MAATQKTKTKKKTVSKTNSTVKKVVKKTSKKTVTKKTASVKKTAPVKKATPKKKPEPTKKVSTVKKSEPVKKTSTKKKAAPSAKSKTAQPQNFTPYKSGRNEDYMNDAQKSHFRELLLAWKRNLMEEVDKTVHHMKDDVTNFPDPNDRASQEEEFSLELRARDRERKLIKKIDESLDNIDDDEYGYCDACGIEIGVERLEARPTATMCIDCKTLEEIKEKQTRA